MLYTKINKILVKNQQLFSDLFLHLHRQLVNAFQELSLQPPLLLGQMVTGDQEVFLQVVRKSGDSRGSAYL